MVVSLYYLLCLLLHLNKFDYNSMWIKIGTSKSDWFEMVLIDYNEKYVVWTLTQHKITLIRTSRKHEVSDFNVPENSTIVHALHVYFPIYEGFAYNF